MKGSKSIAKVKDNPLIVFIVIFSCCIELSAPIIVYGLQIIFLFFISCWLLLTKKISRFNNKDFLFLFFILFVLTLFTLFQQSYLKYQELLAMQYVRVVFWVVYGWIVFLYLRTQSLSSISTALKYVILTMSISVLIQVVAYYFIGENVIDYSLLLGGVPSRILFEVFRPSGLTTEPAIYSGIMMGLLSIYYCILKRIDSVILAGGGSIFLTQSIAGIIMVSLYFLVIIFSKPTIMKFSFVFVALCFVLMAVYPLFEARYERLITGDDSSNSTKIETFKNMLSIDQIMYSGYGLVGKSESAPSYYEGLYDVTLWGAMIVIFGIPVGILFDVAIFLFFMKMPVDFTIKILLLISLIKLTSPMFLFFNVFVALVFIIRGNAVFKFKNSDSVMV
ncbi:hypothetical protein [Aeromonas sp. R2-3]|uniref:hypothetical protein n=1 Tax=Aeromonas TaxID=642 RepID=UPI0034A0D4EC